LSRFFVFSGFKKVIFQLNPVFLFFRAAPDRAKIYFKKKNKKV